jgi:hypothetical protein
LRWARQNATFQALLAVDGREALPIIHLSQEVLGCKDTTAKAIITSLTSVMGMPARFAFFLASSIMMMNWGMPSA